MQASGIEAPYRGLAGDETYKLKMASGTVGRAVSVLQAVILSTLRDESVSQGHFCLSSRVHRYQSALTLPARLPRPLARA